MENTTHKDQYNHCLRILGKHADYLIACYSATHGISISNMVKQADDIGESGMLKDLFILFCVGEFAHIYVSVTLFIATFWFMGSYWAGAFALTMSIFVIRIGKYWGERKEILTFITIPLKEFYLDSRAMALALAEPDVRKFDAMAYRFGINPETIHYSRAVDDNFIRRVS